MGGTIIRARRIMIFVGSVMRPEVPIWVISAIMTLIIAPGVYRLGHDVFPGPCDRPR
jgi:hypothetical protein